MLVFSVVIPSFNRASTLSRAIESVLGQSFGDFELIVVDDGSTDNTEAVVASFLEDSRVRYFRTSNQGVSAARNFGVSKASGQYLAFLDSDDEWLPEKLQLQHRYLESHPDCQLLHGEEIWIRRGVRVNPMKKHSKSGGDIFKKATRFCCMSPSTIVIDRKFFLERGGFDETFPVCEDYDLWLRLCFDQDVGFISEFLIKKYGGHEDQLSQRFHSMDYWRVKALLKILSFSLSAEQKSMVEKEILKKRKILLKGYKKHQNLENYDEVFFSHLMSKKVPRSFADLLAGA